MKRAKVWMSILVFLAISTSQTGNASCASPVPPRQNMQQSDAVFSGEVTQMNSPTLLHEVFTWGYPVTFKVLESWKGVTTTSITLKGQTHQSLAVPFEQGQQYLIYAYYEGQNGRGPLTTNGCKGTKILADAQADLQALGAGPVELQPPPVTESRQLTRLLLISGAVIVLSGAIMVARFRRRSS